MNPLGGRKTIEGRIVNAIFEDLRDRRTLKWMFAEVDAGGSERIDTEVQNEIRRTWRKIIRKEIQNTP